MKLKNIAIGMCAALAAAFTPIGAKANINDMDAHSRLWDTLEEAGVTLVMNSHTYCDKDTAGAYSSTHMVMFICQESARTPYKPIEWTPFDLDTLRHEAHHVVQDCLNGGIGDNKFSPLFDREDEFTAFVEGSLTPDEIDWVIKTYASQGADEEMIIQELEAFASAKSVSAGTIADAVNNTCGARN